MFENFTDRARRVVVLAQEQAHITSAAYIYPSHLALAIIREGESLGYSILAATCNPEVVKSVLESTLPTPLCSPPKEIPFSTLAKEVLEHARTEARILGHNYVGVEHILLGLLHPSHSPAYHVLVAQGLGPTDVRRQIVALVGSSQKAVATTILGGGGGGGSWIPDAELDKAIDIRRALEKDMENMTTSENNWMELTLAETGEKCVVNFAFVASCVPAITNDVNGETVRGTYLGVSGSTSLIVRESIVQIWGEGTDA